MEMPEYVRKAMQAQGVDPDALPDPVDPPDDEEVAPPVTVGSVDEFAGIFGEPEQLDIPLPVTGKFAGSDATDTEWEAGAAKEVEDAGPLKPGLLGHQTLLVFGREERLTAYEVSYRMCGDYHGRRREVRRLFDRGFVAKAGTMVNPSVNGRDHVDAFVITDAGRSELRRLGEAG